METKRLIIRTLTNKDAYDIFKNIYHDEKVQETFLANYVESFDAFNFDRIIDYFEKNRSFYYGIELKDTHECIGMIFENEKINEDIEIGYAIGFEHWNNGYVSEALEAVIDELKNTDQILSYVLWGLREIDGINMNDMTSVKGDIVVR